MQLLISITLSQASARCWKVAPQTGRLSENVGHQGEELTYRVVNAAISKGAPPVVWWPWKALPWSTQLMNATISSKVLVGGPSPCDSYHTFHPVIKRPQWSSNANHLEARRRAYAACGLGREEAPSAVETVRILGREDDLLAQRRLELCGLKTLERRIANPEALVEAAESAAAKTGIRAKVEIVNISSRNPGDFCEQITRFATASVVVSIHGAHLVNAPFLPPGGLLFEVLPWAHTKKQHHSRLLRNTDLRYDKLCAPKPPGITRTEDFCEGRSQAARKCTAIVRDCHATRILTQCPSSPSSGKLSRRPCDCVDHFEKQLAVHFTRRRRRRGNVPA